METEHRFKYIKGQCTLCLVHSILEIYYVGQQIIEMEGYASKSDIDKFWNCRIADFIYIAIVLWLVFCFEERSLRYNV